MELFSQAFVLFLTLFIMMVGLIFTVIPPLPGTVIIWAASIFYGVMVGWEKLGWWTFGFMTLLMVVGIVADFLGGQLGAKVGGASCLAVALGTVTGFILGILGSIIGTPVAGCFAGIVGTLGGILLFERFRYGSWENALDATKGFLAGTTAGVLAKVTAGSLMFGLFLVRVFFG